MMSNRDRLLDGLHSVLAQLWDGSDQVAASEVRSLIAWRARAVRPFTPAYVGGTFPAPASQPGQNLDFLQAAEAGLQSIEAALSACDSNTAVKQVKELLSSLSGRQPI